MKNTMFAIMLAAATLAVRAEYKIIEDIGFDYTSVRFLVANPPDPLTAGQTLSASLRNLTSGEVSNGEATTTASLTNSVSVAELTAGATYAWTLTLAGSEIGSGTIALRTKDDSISFDGTDLAGATQTNGSIAGGKLTPTSEDTAMTITKGDPPSGVHVSIAMTAEFTYPQDSLPTVTDQGAITLADSGWKCWDKESGDGGAWVAITNANVATAAGSRQLFAECDYTLDAPTVTYAIGAASNTMKTAAEKSVFKLVGDKPTKLSELDFLGSGSISALDVEYWIVVPSTNVVVNADEGTITITGNTAADLSQIAPNSSGYVIVQGDKGKVYNMTWTDVKTGDNKRYAVVENGKLVVKGGTPANGIDSYDSHVLGLDAEDAKSKPLLKSEQNASSSELSFSVANIVPKSNLADVTCTLTELDSPDAASGTTKATFAPGETKTVDLPTSVKYYKLSIRVKAK